MNQSIVARKMDLTDGMRTHIEGAFEQFEKYNLDIIAAKAIVSESRKSHKNVVEIEFTIQLAKHDTIVIKQGEKDFYTAIDKAVDRAKKVLRRHHDRLSSNRRVNEKACEVPMFVSEEEFDNENDEDEIVPAESCFDKLIEIEEALMYLKERNAMFLVFNDMDGRQRTLYRRKDGKFGLY